MKEFRDRVAVVTGAASGIGRGMAEAFAAAGMKVVLSDLRNEALEATTESIASAGGRVAAIAADVRDPEQVDALARRTVETFGGVHVGCNNAGVALNGNIAEMTYKDWDWVMKVNLDGVINGLVTFIDDIKAHGEGGHFVNTASIAGQYGMPGLGIYCASKFAVVGMSETMRIDLARDNIGVSVLCPGVVETGIGASERNRPDEYGGTATPAMSQRGDPPAMELNVMQPSEIGEVVLHAIQNDVFYILTHSEFAPAVTGRSEEISKAFAYWAEYGKSQSS